MSCNYADGLSPYDNKGVLGLAENFDSKEVVEKKCKELAQLIKESKYTVIHSGAGISTSAGIPDFRGPKGVWTLEEKGLKPDINVSFGEAKPTKTHMAIKKFIDEGLVHFVVSQNIDGLHLKSGVSREYLAELHGNMFIEQCNICKRQYVRSSPSLTVGQRSSGDVCKSEGRPCRGKLQDTILDWEHSLPDDDLELSDMHSSLADLSICLGTTLQIVPSGNIPLNTLRCGGKLVICNLQPTKHDNKADLIINTYVDDVMEKVSKILGITIPAYSKEKDPTFQLSNVLEWTINKSVVSKIKTMHRKKCFGVPKKRKLTKEPNNFKYREKADDDKPQKIKKAKLEKTKSKIPKPKKPQKSKKVKDESDDIIVIGDEDSDDSDVICLEDDKNVEMESTEKERNVENNKNDLVTPINIDENVIKNNLDIPKVDIKNNTDILKDDTKHNDNIPKDDKKSNQDDLINNIDIPKDEIKNTVDIPKDDIKNNKVIPMDIKKDSNIPEENIKSNIGISRNELKYNENTQTDENIINNKDFSDVTKNNIDIPKDDIKNNGDIPENDIKNNISIADADIKSDIDIQKNELKNNENIPKDDIKNNIDILNDIKNNIDILDDIKNNINIGEDNIKSNVDIHNDDIPKYNIGIPKQDDLKNDVDIENRSDCSTNHKVIKDCTEDRLQNADNKKVYEDKNIRVEGIQHNENNLSEIESKEDKVIETACPETKIDIRCLKGHLA